MSELSEEVAQALVVRESGEVNYHFEPATFSFDEGGIVKSLYVIPIAEIEGRLLVALPVDAWDRSIAKRLVPKNTLTKALKVAVACALVNDREFQVEEDCNLWLGFMDKSYVPGLKMGRIQEPVADVYRLRGDTEDLLLPYAQSLMEAADEQFSFMSAMSEGGEEQEEAAEAFNENFEKRMSEMEKMMKGMQKNLQNFMSMRESGEALERGKKTKKAAEPARGSKEDGGNRSHIAGLDPSVVAAARKAGIGEMELLKLGAMVSKSHKLADAPNVPKRKIPVMIDSDDDGLPSEHEEEELLPEDDVQDGKKTPMERAVVQLTKIVGSLASQKKPRGLDAMLDGAEGDSHEGSGSSSGKSKAALYKRLRKCLLEDPKYLYETIEDLMEEDFLAQRVAPGVPGLSLVSSRAWMEYRSRLQHYPTTLRYVWSIAGIHDCLRNGRTEEARARAALALAAADQTSLDGGSWLLSQEVMMEEPPPFASFQGKKIPETWEQSVSKLVDERWQDVLMWKIKNKDTYLESRKRLNQGKSGGKGDPGKREEAEKPNPKKKGGGKTGGKADGKRKSEEDPPAGSH